MQSLLTTIQNRPYVVAFLISFLIISLLNRGVARTVAMLMIGYTVAFLSEFCSIHWGFPYGMYHYLYENMPGELMFFGVPIWDSISYVFIAYAAFETAHFLNLPLPLRERVGVRGSIIIFGAFLMMLLDIVVDPLAVRGDQWFLGKIFYYHHDGFYFGVPITNFAGWFLVGLTILSLFSLIKFKKPSPLRTPILAPLFYLSIILFNIIVTFWIGAWSLGLASSGIFLVLVFLIFRKGFNSPYS